MDFFPVSPMDFDKRRSSSQYCCARPSETRLRVAAEGARQSVANTGSHTMKARMFLPDSCFKTCSTAEAPRRQYVQVGERRVITRTEPFASLNALRNSLKFAVSSRASGC